MDNSVGHKKVKPFDSFVILYKILGWAGYYKLIERPKNKYLEMLHYVYRFIIFIFVITYNIQHILFFLSIFKQDIDLSFEGLMIEIPQVNLVAKVLAVNIGKAKLEKLREVMNDPIFEASCDEDEKLLRENQDRFWRLTKTIIIGICCSALLWTLTAIVKRITDKTAVVPIYVPFYTDTWTGFSFTIVLEHGPVFWTGFGHLALDILIGCHYSQATVQLKIIKCNLEHLCDSEKVPGYVGSKNARTYRYVDEMDENIKKRFAHYVKRYGTVLWFVEEATAVFNSAISVQFLTTSSVICLVIYKLSKASPGTVEFIFLVVYFFILQLQVVLYCIFGELLVNESKFVNDSIYQSEWLSLSPKFRKLLLIGMAHWGIPVVPKAVSIVPLTLKTFITLIRGAFNLFTVLKTTNNS